MRHAARMQRASDGRPIRWGILGTGRVAGRFAQALRELDDARLLAAGSRRLATAEAFARHHGVERAYGSYAQLAADPDLDIVYVASPHALHREHSLLCLEAGRAVLCEKPFALNATEAREVIASARSRGLFCMEAMWTRFLPAMRRLTELVDAGAIGELRMVTAQLGFPSEPDPSSRLFDPALGGGALLDLGVYPLALASQLLGRPVEVASAATLDATGVDEQSALLLRYEGGGIASLGASLRNLALNEAYIVGSTGQIRVHGPLNQPQALTVTPTPSPTRSPTRTPSRPPPDTSRFLHRVRRQPALGSLAARLAHYRRQVRPAGARTVHAPFAGNGLHEQAAEAMRCLRAGLAETPLMPLDESIAILETMDTARRQWGLVYPQERGG